MQERQKLSWLEALDQYKYPVDFRAFRGKAGLAEEWFNLDIAKGDREETVQFENRFRSHAGSRFEPWYEVIFWKMASQGRRADVQTERAIRHIKERGIKAEDLWLHCFEFVASGKKNSFLRFQKLLFKSESIATALTFSAFCCPAKFPMVDTRIARYVAFEGLPHRFRESREIEKTLSRYREKSSPGVLTTRDWPFVEAWFEWCREMAPKLPGTVNITWRARDVEMAVFRAWGERKERGKGLKGPCYRLSCDGTVT